MPETCLLLNSLSVCSGYLEFWVKLLACRAPVPEMNHYTIEVDFCNLIPLKHPHRIENTDTSRESGIGSCSTGSPTAQLIQKHTDLVASWASTHNIAQGRHASKSMIIRSYGGVCLKKKILRWGKNSKHPRQNNQICRTIP